MKLEGSLDAFSLPDVFQLLSFTKKSGGLHLAHDGSDGVVFFAGGQISGASADSSRQPLARRLVGSGTLTDEALADAIQVALSGEGVGVVRALLDQGAVDAELLRVAAGDQSVDAVFDLLRWQNGDFAFVMDEANPDDVGVSMSVEAVLADAEARRASWDSVSQVVPSPQAVLAMPVVLPADPQVSREEWSLLALVDGRRTVTELVDLTGSGQYAVVSTLAALVTRGLLEVRAEGGAETLRTPTTTSPWCCAASGCSRRWRVSRSCRSRRPRPRSRRRRSRRRQSRSGRPRRSTVSDAAPEPMHSVPDLADESTSDEDGERELATASAGLPEGLAMLGGAHVPQDVVPPRPEPFLPRRQADFDEQAGTPAARPVHVQAGPSASMGGLGDVVGATATSPDPDSVSVIERDPNVNRSLMLRLIAGVRGL